jgi:DNA-directed RNA polymerase subunit M/transcription elongation factor TFIIS
MEGEQYELWEPDVQPLPSEMVAHQPKFIAVECPKCQTLMYATEKQIGETIDCPDCGRAYVVPAPKKPKAKPSPLANDIDVPMLDPASAPTERPTAMSPVLRRQIEQEERESEYGKALEKSRRTGKPMEVDVRGRPILPRWPLFTGVLPFLFSSGVPIRWLAISAGLGIGGGLILSGLALAMSGGFGAIAGMCFFAIGCVITMVFASIAFSIFRTIVAESSEGVREIQNWPNAFDWFGDFFTFVVAAMMSVFPAWLISYVLPNDPLTIAVAVGIGIVTCFPLAVLSQMDIGSIWGVVSPRVVLSVFKCPFSWLTFWIQTGVMGAAWVGAVYATEQVRINPMIVAAPLGAAGLILYARLLGRLGWRLSEILPASK